MVQIPLHTSTCLRLCQVVVPSGFGPSRGSRWAHRRAVCAHSGRSTRRVHFITHTSAGSLGGNFQFFFRSPTHPPTYVSRHPLRAPSWQPLREGFADGCSHAAISCECVIYKNLIAAATASCSHHGRSHSRALGLQMARGAANEEHEPQTRTSSCTRRLRSGYEIGN